MTDALPPDETPPVPAAEQPPTPVWIETLFVKFRQLDWRVLAIDLMLVILFWVGVYFRFDGLNWNQGTNLHPDEYGLTGTLTRMRWPETLDEYFNTRLSPLSPYQKFDENGQFVADGPDNGMRWGQWPIIMLKGAAVLLDQQGYEEQRLLGRQLSALADVLSLIVLYFIGSRLYNRRVALLAAALSALAVMQIQQSHFMTADNFAVLFTTCALYAAVRVAQNGNWRWYALFGVFFGMAVASRVNLAPLAGMVAVAAFIANANQLEKLLHWGPASRRTLLLLALAGGAALLTFRVTQPMAFRAETGDTTLFTWELNESWTNMLQLASAESDGRAGGPPGEQWANRPALLFPWLNMVLWGMGAPLGLAAWAGFAAAMWQLLRADWREEIKRHLIPVVWAGGMFLFMGTRWVKSVRYFLPIYPMLCLLAAWGIYALWNKLNERWQMADSGPSSIVRRLIGGAVFTIVVLGTFAWAYGFTNIYRTPNTRVAATLWMYHNLPAPLALQMETLDGTHQEPIAMPEAFQLTAGAPYRIEVKPRVSGTLNAVTLFRARNLFDASQPGTVRVTVATDPDGNNVLAEAFLRVEPNVADPRGSSAAASVPAIPLQKDQGYFILVSALDAPMQISQAVLANESWDEGLPVPFDARDPFGGLYRGLTMEVRWPDDENKRQMFLGNLAQVDYIILPSQRALWAHSRIPLTYPMTMEYYKALFDGRLGFELVQEFQSPITLGPLQISDVAGTWAWGQRPDLTPEKDNPFNFNPLAAEEAFSVYDHAPVWVFKKRADFDLNTVTQLLYAFDLSKVVVQGPRDATQSPSLMMLPADLLSIQRAGGTWSEMFDAASLLNTSEPVAVVVWYLALLVIGALAWPLTYTAFGGLSDKGYPLAKTVALLTVTWLVWFSGSLRLLSHTRGTVALGFVVLAVISSLLLWRKRGEMLDWAKNNWRHIVIVEVLGLLLFGFMLFIRWGNPDLWHPNFGGEKPMDFSYFNAVLKSTYFPPYDPWLAGGYLNYYYYGFVVASLLTKLLGVVPALAYNLILPMLFSLVGLNAFCAAYNLAARTQNTDDRRQTADGGEQLGVNSERPEVDGEPLVGEGTPAAVSDESSVSNTPSVINQPPSAPLHVSPFGKLRAGSFTLHALPYIAGIAAMLMVVVLGNLGQIRTFTEAFKRAADGGEGWGAVLNGITRVASGQALLPVSLGSWYWDATRIVPGVNGSGSEITEFPFFTFLYADLHAHMIVMPFTVLAVVWAISYLLGYQLKRGWPESLALWAIGGLTIGVTRPSNTWDYPMYLALGLAAIVSAHFLATPRLTRASLWRLLWRVGLLMALTIGLYRPFDQWVAVPLTELKLWENERTPLEAYFYIYGLFFFLIVSWILLEVRRWLAETPVTILDRAAEWLPSVLMALGAFLVSLLAFLLMGVRVAAVALPLIALAGLLILRGQAALTLEKRAALFLFGTGLAVTIFVDVAVLGGDRMNTIFKLYMQVWFLLSIAAGAALAWVLAEAVNWRPMWRNGWTIGLAVLVGSAALYTVTAANAKMRDRFPGFAISPDGGGCQAIPNMVQPYEKAPDPDEQPRGLNGLNYMTFSAYCDEGYFLPLKYDYEAIRWLQDNVPGSPVLLEAQNFNLYRITSRYAWNTGLPNVVGWDWHQRQQRGAGPTQYISERGAKVSLFYCAGMSLTPENFEKYRVCQTTLQFWNEAGTILDDPAGADGWAERFLREYDVKYIVVGTLERAYYPPEGLAKLDRMAAAGQVAQVYQNPGVTIYEVRTSSTATN